MRRMLILLMLLVMSVAYAAPNPGHDASSIGPGTFSAGNYTFPNNLTIAKSLLIDTNTLTVDSVNHRVGIGTASPSTLLALNSTIITDMRMDSGITNYARLTLNNGVILAYGANASDANGMLIASTGNLTFDAGNSDVMFMNGSNRFVGIGTVKPLAKLHVQYSATTPSPTNVYGLLVEMNDNDNSRYIFQTATSVGKSFSITNAGNIGVNTSTPVATLHINSSNALGALRVENTSNVTLFIVNGSSGNVGIGTAAPSDSAVFGRALDIYGTNGAAVYLRYATDPTQYGMIGYDRTGYGLLLAANNALPINLFTNGTAKMTILSGGNVGIGTAAPGVKLEVNGSTLIRNGNLYIRNAAENNNVVLTNIGSTGESKLSVQTNSENRLVVDQNGLVGIGTELPTQKLDVNGSVNISGSSAKLYAPEICLNGDCQTSWPAGGGNSSSAGGWTNTSSVVSLASSANNISAGTLIVDNTNSRVGIGMSPSRKLDVYDNFAAGTYGVGIVGATGAARDILIVGQEGVSNGFTVQYTASGMQYGFASGNLSVATSSFFVDGARANVGIGTAAPNAWSGVSGLVGVNEQIYSSVNQARVVINAAASNPELHLVKGNNGANDKNYRLIVNAGDITLDQPADDYSSTQQLMTWTNSGNVGIGTSAPAGTLEVHANAGSNSDIRLTDDDVLHGMTSVLPNNTYMRFGPYGSVNGGGFVQGLSNAGNVPAFTVQGYSGGTPGTTPVVDIAVQKKNGTGVISLASNDTAFQIENGGAGAGTKLFTVMGDGSVGIGVVNPNAPLVVSKAVNSDWMVHITNTGTNPYGLSIDTTANAGSAFTLAAYTNVGTGLFVQNDGKVGIGETAPGARLHIEGTSNAANALLRIDNGGDTTVLLGQDVAGTGHNEGKLQLSDNGVLTTVIRSAGNSYIQGGNVGIGDATPTNKLDVSGAIGISDTTIIDASRNIVNANAITLAGNITMTGQASSRIFMGGVAGTGFGLAYDASNPNYGMFYKEGSPDKIVLAPDGGGTSGTAFVVDGNGGVGIGANPIAGPKLYINSAVASGGTGLYSLIQNTAGSNYGIDAEAQGSGAAVNTGLYAVALGATTNYAIYVPNGYPAAGTNNYQLYLASDSKSFFNGSVGIGSTAPSSLLEVRGASGVRITDPANQYRGNLVFGNDGNGWESGIRTYDNGDAEMRIWHMNAQGQIVLAANYNGDQASAMPTDGLFIAGDSGVNRVGIGYTAANIRGHGGKLLVNGNVGIGTASPSAPLDVPSTANPGVKVGDGSTGYLKVGGSTWYDDATYFSLAGGRNFYLRRAEVPTTYIYSPNIYLGDGGSGTNVHFRDAAIDGNGFSITSSGAATFAGLATSTPAIFSTSSSGAPARTVTILESGDAQVNYGAYPGAWRSALQIQGNDPTYILHIIPPEAGSTNAVFRSTAGGFVFATGGNTGTAGTTALSMDTSGNVVTPVSLGVDTIKDTGGTTRQTMGTNVVVTVG